MLGLIGAFIYGMFIDYEWAKEERAEKESRSRAFVNNRSFYIDKNGRMRHANNGKLFTPKEIHNFLNPISLKEKCDLYDNKVQDRNKKIFYMVKDKFDRHYFLTKEDALEYISYHDFAKLDDRLYSIVQIESEMFCNTGTKIHFDINKFERK